MVCEFDERAEEFCLLVEEAARYVSGIGLQMHWEHPNPTCIPHDSLEVTSTGKWKAAELRKSLEQKNDLRQWLDQCSMMYMLSHC